METEKVCVNLAAAELGKIDVLVAEGLFASRTDLIRAGIRTVLESNPQPVDRAVGTGARIGFQLLSRSELEEARRSGVRLNIFVVGVLRIQSSVDPALAEATIARIRIFGSVRGPEDVLKHIDDRIVRGTDNLGDWG